VDFGAISYVGDLKNNPIGRLLVSFHRQKATGALALRRDKVAKRIFFREGYLVDVESSLSRERCIRLALSRGLLDRSEAMNLYEQIAAENLSESSAIVQTGKLTDQEGAQLAAEARTARLTEIFAWPEGQYAFFFDKTTAEADAQRNPIRFQDAILEGYLARTSKDTMLAEIREQLSDPWTLHLPVEQILQQLELSQNQARLIRRIDGKSPLEKIVFGEKAALNQTIATLLTLRVLGFAGSVSEEVSLEVPPVPSGLSEELTAYAKRLIELGPAIMESPPLVLLRVGPDFTDTDLRRGYYQLAQQFHQREIIDQFPEPLQEMSAKVFERISACFESLLEWDKANREQLLDVLFVQNEKELFPEPATFAQAEIEFLKGLELHESNKFGPAFGKFSEAASHLPMEGEYKAYKAMAGYRSETASYESAVLELQRATAIDPSFVDVSMMLAGLLEEGENGGKARPYYETMLKWSPDHELAREGLNRTKKPFQVEGEAGSEESGEQWKEVEVQLRKFLKKTEEQDYFEILGIEHEASVVEVRRAYFKLAKEFHPDRLGTMKDHPMAEEVFLRINSAYSTLSSDKKRRFYERALRSREKEVQFEHSQKRMELERRFIKAKAFLKDHRYDQAIEIFTELDKMRDGCAECKAHIGYAIFLRDVKTDPAVLQKAEQYLKEAVLIDPSYQDVNLFWGKIYRQKEQFPKAMGFFQRVLKVDPDNVDALREIRLINQRTDQASASPRVAGTKEADKDKKGIFGGIFGRKK
jgi:curved DNA-binding protein CbpA